MRKLGMNLGTWPDMDRKQDIAYLRQAGFDATFAYYFHATDGNLLRETAELLDQNGIEFDTVHAPFWGVNEMWKDSETGESFFGELMDSLKVTADCRVPVAVVHLSSGDHPPFLNAIGMERYDRLVYRAGELGLLLAFENQRKIANLAYIMERYERNPHVGFCWDVGHEYCLSGGWKYMPMFGDRLAALHIHDNPCVHNADHHMIPGDGKIDFSEITGQIRKSGYHGTMMLELMKKPSGKYKEVKPLEYYEKAYQAACRLRAMTDGDDSPCC